MRDNSSSETSHLTLSDSGDCLFEAVQRQVNDERLEKPQSYRLALGREIIHLGIVEFQILFFLASKPYFPFSRHHIADAVSTERHPVTEDTVDQYIVSLRNQLGIFHDYVQSVPYIGYRFKA